MNKKGVTMLSGSITKGLLSISLPVMIMNVVQSLFSILDMTILESFDTDGLSVGAVGACGSLIVLITGLIIGISSGANVIIAGYIGSRKYDSANRAVGTAIAFAAVAGIALSVIGISCAELFLRWTNCPDVLLARATLYFRLYFSGVPLLTVYSFAAAIHNSTGDSRRPMILSFGSRLAPGNRRCCCRDHCGLAHHSSAEHSGPGQKSRCYSTADAQSPVLPSGASPDPAHRHSRRSAAGAVLLCQRRYHNCRQQFWPFRHHRHFHRQQF